MYFDDAVYSQVILDCVIFKNVSDVSDCHFQWSQIGKTYYFYVYWHERRRQTIGTTKKEYNEVNRNVNYLSILQSILRLVVK